MGDFRDLSIGIIGGGRVGAPLGRALQNSGWLIGSISGSSKDSRARIKKLLPTVPNLKPEEVAAQNDILILAVPDDHLVSLITSLEAAGSLKPGQYVLHTSGSKGLGVFASVTTPIRPIALHPAMTFTGSRYDVRRLFGATYGVTVAGESGKTKEERLARALIAALNGTIVMLNEEQRVLYHAALTHGANYLVTLVSQSFQMLETAGIEDAETILKPLLNAALGNALFKQGEALSGPISRGDVEVVQGHRRVIGEACPDLLPVYDVLGEATVDLAEATGRIDAEQAEALHATLDQG